MKKWIDRLFVLGVFAFLLASLGLGILRPKEVNAYENRPAERFPALTLSAAASGEFQDGVEAALADQVPLAQRMKRAYNVAQSALERACLRPVLAGKPMRYIRYGGLNIFAGDYLLYDVKPLETVAEALDRKRENYNQVFAAHPELTFYVYFIEKDTEVNLETGENSGAWDYFVNGLDLPAEQTGKFATVGFEDYAAHFYRTDHHWNAQGSYEGYRQVAALLGIPEGELVPRGEAVLVQSGFFGSKSASLGSESFTEDFWATPYAYPAMAVAIDGQPAEDYGRQEEFLAGSADPVKYGAFYGGDDGQVDFDTGTQGRGSLLVIGESFDNAILKLLAAHFDTTRAVDLRYYQERMGRPFSLEEAVRETGADKVLLIGSEAYFTLEDFALGD